MKRLIRPLIFIILFSASFLTSSFSQTMSLTQTELNLNVLNSVKNRNLSKAKKEILSILEFAVKAKQSGRETENGRFLLNDAEIDCHGNVVTGQKFCGLVSFETRTNGDFILHGFKSVFSKKDDVTIVFSKSEMLGETSITLFTETSKTEISLDAVGAGSYKETVNGEFSNSISWNENGTGKWAKINKTGKFSSGEFGTESEVAMQ